MKKSREVPQLKARVIFCQTYWSTWSSYR